MRRSVGFTFTGEGVTHGLKMSAPFRVSEVSAGTEAAQKLLVGDEIVQVDELKGLETLYPVRISRSRLVPCISFSINLILLALAP